MTDPHSDIASAPDSSSRSFRVQETLQGFFPGAHDFAVNNSTFIINTVQYLSESEERTLGILERQIQHDVGFEAAARFPPPRCCEGTRKDIIAEIESWMRSPPAGRAPVLWLNGPAGIGKSAIMQTICERQSGSSSMSILGASIFLSKDKSRGDPQRIFATIAYYLALKYESYRKHVVKMLNDDPTIIYKSIHYHFRDFIYRPVTKQLFPNSQILIVLDGLDECSGLDEGRDDKIQREIVKLIGELPRESALMWLISSRPEPSLQAVFGNLDGGLTKVVTVLVDSDQACLDVEKYLRASFRDIVKKYPSSFDPSMSHWPSDSQISKIASHAKGLFLLASDVVNFIDNSAYSNPISQLEDVLNTIDSTSPSENNPFVTSDRLFTDIMSRVPETIADIPKYLSLLHVKDIFLYHKNGKSYAEGCNFLGITRSQAASALSHLQSVLIVPNEDKVNEDNLEAYHKSFRDFLKSPSRSKSYCLDFSEVRKRYLEAAIRILSESCNDAGNEINCRLISLSWGPLYEGYATEDKFALYKQAWNLLLHHSHFDALEQLIQNGCFDKLCTFFSRINFGEDTRLFQCNEIARLDYIQPLLFAKLEEWGLAKSIPLPAFHLRNARLTKQSTVARLTWKVTSDEGPTDSRNIEHELDKNPSARTLTRADDWKPYLKRFLPRSIDELLESGEDAIECKVASFQLDDKSGWKVDLEQHLSALWRKVPPHRIYIVGREEKAHALIWLVLEKQLWAYSLPYDDPQSELSQPRKRKLSNSHDSRPPKRSAI